MGGTDRSGFTLVELVVAITILGVLSSLAVLSAVRSTARPTSDRWELALDSVRHQSVESGRPVVLSPGTPDGEPFTAFPDGRVVGPDGTFLGRRRGPGR